MKYKLNAIIYFLIVIIGLGNFSITVFPNNPPHERNSWYEDGNLPNNTIDAVKKSGILNPQNTKGRFMHLRPKHRDPGVYPGVYPVAYPAINTA